MEQWHPTKNENLTPADVSFGSERKVWWRCEHDHEWQAPVYARAGANRSDGCPVCAGKVILPGVNDLASRFPDIASQWHPEKNGPLPPDRISPYSNRKVWWVCDLGHEFQTTVAHRTRMNSGYPTCAGRKVLPGFNDLASRHPDVAAQWHPALNGTLTPQMVTPGSHRRVWWVCGEGHIWQAVVHSRTSRQKCGCPICAGKMKPKK